MAMSTAVALPIESCPVLVKLDEFEGRLDDLIDVVRRDSGMLLELELRQLTGQLLEQAEDLPLGDAGTSLVITASLLNAKTILVIRRVGAREGDPDHLGELDQELLEQLEECKALVEELRERGEVSVTAPAKWVSPKCPRAEKPKSAEKMAKPFTLEDLDAELLGITKEIEGALELRRDPYTAAVVLADLSKLLEVGEGRVTWAEIASRGVRFQIALFLALLEQVRQHRVRMIQPPGENLVVEAR